MQVWPFVAVIVAAVAIVGVVWWQLKGFGKPIDKKLAALREADKALDNASDELANTQAGMDHKQKARRDAFKKNPSRIASWLLSLVGKQ